MNRYREVGAFIRISYRAASNVYLYLARVCLVHANNSLKNVQLLVAMSFTFTSTSETEKLLRPKSPFRASYSTVQ